MKGRKQWCKITKVVYSSFKELKRWELALKSWRSWQGML